MRTSFRVHNLLDPIDGLGEFDAIVFRNVLPQMAKPVRARIADQIISQLLPGGALLLGEEEKLPIVSDDLASVEELRNVFVRGESPAVVAAA